MKLSLVILIFSFIHCLSLVQAKNIIYNFENGNYGQLNTKCAIGKESVQEIRLLDGFNISKPSNGIYAYYSAKGHGCFETNEIQIGQNTILELEYYLFGGSAEIKTNVKDGSAIVDNYIFKLSPVKSWTKVNHVYKEFPSINSYTVSVVYFNS